MPGTGIGVTEALQPAAGAGSRARQPKRMDVPLLAGIAIAAGAAVLGIASTGVGLNYFLQPAGALIVLGGTLGVILVTTPGAALVNSARRVRSLFSPASEDREALIEEIISYARAVRREGTVSFEQMARKASDGFLRDALLLALDVKSRGELQSALETELRMNERQGEMDAKTLEVAGGFAPTLGILGTAVGLIDVMRQFSNIQSVGLGVGTAFVSTIYGLGLANLLLLPAAHRIRARVAETFETQELMAEGVLCIFDGMHPWLIRQRLSAFLRQDGKAASARARMVESAGLARRTPQQGRSEAR
ncbi:MAG: MotA/TolQ/ExbB proton channel family protein [Bryobacteraceae bacterium]